MPIATIHKLSQGADLYHIHFLDQRTDPGFGRPGGPVDPDYGRPEGGRPDNTLPGSGNRPDNTLPGRPGNPAFPDNSLPGTPPPNLAGGWTLVLVRGPDGKWHYAAVAPSDPPPRPLPPPTGGNRPDNTLPPGVDNTLPGQQPPPAYPDNTLPPAPMPKPAG